MRNVQEIIESDDEFYRKLGENTKNNLRVACPGIIKDFDIEEQTVTVQPTLREQINNMNYEKQWVELPMLLNVPICFPRSGGYEITMPIKQGDECLVIFLDSCMDAWWSYGGIQNQIERRRHDLSDAVAILGIWSQPRRIKNYSNSSCQLRNEEGSSYIELKDNNINIVADSVNINGIDFGKHTHALSSGEETSAPNG